MGRLTVNLKGQKQDIETKKLINTYTFRNVSEEESRNILGRWRDREIRKVTYYPEGKAGIVWDDRK